jgi:hypothetical protein
MVRLNEADKMPLIFYMKDKLAIYFYIIYYENFESKKQLWFLSLALLFLLVSPVFAEKDLIDENKTDSSIKMLVFPKSLRVLENLGNVEMKTIFIDSVRIRKALLKIDPTRIVPTKFGEPFKGPVTKDKLSQLAHQYSEDIIFIFRRTLGNKKNLIRHQGLLYLTRQKKVLALKESIKSISESVKEMDLAGIKILVKEAKKVIHYYKFEKRQSAY